MWFVNDFHVQILLLELLFCLRLQHRPFFPVRLLPSVVLYAVLPLLIPGSFFAPFFTIGWFTYGFLFMFLLSGLILWFCFRMNLRQVIFYGCVAHTLQHMVHCLYRVSELVFSLSFAVSQSLQLLYMVLACLLVFFRLRDRFRDSETVDMAHRHLVPFALASTLVIYVLSYWTTLLETETVGVLIFDCFSCLLLLCILMDLFRIRKAERDQLIMERLLRQEQEQHQLSRATIDVINRKCHDLRHQITALRNMNHEAREKSISDLEKAVLIYDSFPKSGNEDLDLILAEKSLLAEQQHIVIRSVFDGQSIAFMNIEDLYCLMGNAFDNAIEGASHETNEGRRIITVIGAPKDNLFSLHMENPCPVQPLFMDGLPVTSKPDTDYHGFGMRSMRYLCEKYNGVLTTSWDHGIFILDILFPIAAPSSSQPAAPAS